MSDKRHAIDVLKSDILQDFQRPNLFNIEIETKGTGNEGIINLTSDLIASVSYPSTMLGGVTINRMGRKIVIPGDVQNPSDLTMALYCDVEGRVRSFFDAWQRAYYGTEIGGSIALTPTFANPMAYAELGKVTIFGVDGDHRKRHRTTLYYAFPRVLGEMEFSHNSENALSMFSVTLAFSYAEYSNVESSVPQSS